MRLLKYLFSKIKSNFFKIDILVIGNGYDLKKNYKTKFSHFMNQLLYDYIVNILNYKNIPRSLRDFSFKARLVHDLPQK